VSVQARAAGRGEAVLCLHGIGSSSRSFAEQLSGWSGRRRVLAWDAPGYGASPDPVEAPGMSGYADAAAALLRKEGIRRAHVVGMSFGGVVAVRLAARHPDLVRSLVLGDSTPGSGSAPASREAMLRRIPEMAELGSRAVAAARSARLLSPAAPAELRDRLIVTAAEDVRLPGFGYAAEAMAATDHTELLSTLRVPTLVVCGEHDVVTPWELSHRMAALVPGARLAVVPGAGHVSNQEQPGAFNDLVEAFLDEVESGAVTSATPEVPR
jgi:pimeloyl-ACP methyl ester carboxylesterase